MVKKKDKKKYDLTPLAKSTEYYVMFDSGYGKEHEYTIKVTDTVSGTLYSVNHSDCSMWGEELKGKKSIELLNTGDGFAVINKFMSKSFIDYSNMFLYTVLLKTIEKIESYNRYSFSVVKVEELMNDSL